MATRNLPYIRYFAHFHPGSLPRVEMTDVFAGSQLDSVNYYIYFLPR